MTSVSNYKKENELEKRLFKYKKSDLIKILLEKEDLIEEFYTSSHSEVEEILKNINYDKIAELLNNNLFINEINTELDKLDEENIPKIIKDNFPSKEPRELQLETISKIYDAIENGYKYIILEAVSGFGKSLIAIALSNIYSEGKSYILTPTHLLIDQYINDFKISKLKTRTSFKCKKNGQNCSAYLCAYKNCYHFEASNFKKDFKKSMSCNYLYNLKESLKTNSAICTYDYFIQENFYHSDYLKPRKLLIFDEAHNLDDKFSKAIALKIHLNQFRELGLNESKEYQNIIQNEDYYYYLIKFKKEYESRLKKMESGSHKYISFKKRLNDIKNFMKYFDKSNSNLVFKKDNDYWIFRPIKINEMINDALLKNGEVCIFMSSSIFDHENFAYDMGIDEDEIFSIRVPNIFDLTNNPIKLYNEFNMNAENIKNGMAKNTLRTIKQILKNHNNEKGVIHTTNYDCAFYLKKHIDNYRLKTHYNEKDREKVLNDFKKSKDPLVLISPSMNEGVDLPEDLCRFQIIFKLPYLPPDDSWINKR